MKSLRIKSRCIPPRAGGFTYLELIFALSITAMVALASAAMLGAVTAGVGAKRDSRSLMVNALGAQTRLSSYLAPSRCILAQSATSFTLWQNDSRESGTIHATEIRWFTYSPDTQTFSVHFVEFPNAWTTIAKQLADLEYAKTTDWSTVFSTFQLQGHMKTIILMDRLTGITISMDNADPQASHHINADLTYAGTDGPMSIKVAACIHNHSQPIS